MYLDFAGRDSPKSHYQMECDGDPRIKQRKNKSLAQEYLGQSSEKTRGSLAFNDVILCTQTRLIK